MNLSKSANDAIRNRIVADTEAFLKAGGRIKQLTVKTENKKQDIDGSWKQQSIAKYNDKNITTKEA